MISKIFKEISIVTSLFLFALIIVLWTSFEESYFRDHNIDYPSIGIKLFILSAGYFCSIIIIVIKYFILKRLKINPINRITVISIITFFIILFSSSWYSAFQFSNTLVFKFKTIYLNIVILLIIFFLFYALETLLIKLSYRYFFITVILLNFLSWIFIGNSQTIDLLVNEFHPLEKKVYGYNYHNWHSPPDTLDIITSSNIFNESDTKFYKYESSSFSKEEILKFKDLIQKKNGLLLKWIDYSSDKTRQNENDENLKYCASIIKIIPFYFVLEHELWFWDSTLAESRATYFWFFKWYRIKTAEY